MQIPWNLLMIQLHSSFIKSIPLFSVGFFCVTTNPPTWYQLGTDSCGDTSTFLILLRQELFSLVSCQSVLIDDTFQAAGDYVATDLQRNLDPVVQWLRWYWFRVNFKILSLGRVLVSMLVSRIRFEHFLSQTLMTVIPSYSSCCREVGFSSVFTFKQWIRG